jgi:hypothetical protein
LEINVDNFKPGNLCLHNGELVLSERNTGDLLRVNLAGGAEPQKLQKFKGADTFRAAALASLNERLFAVDPVCKSLNELEHHSGTVNRLELKNLASMFKMGKDLPLRAPIYLPTHKIKKGRTKVVLSITPPKDSAKKAGGDVYVNVKGISQGFKVVHSDNSHQYLLNVPQVEFEVLSNDGAGEIEISGVLVSQKKGTREQLAHAFNFRIRLVTDYNEQSRDLALTVNL